MHWIQQIVIDDVIFRDFIRIIKYLITFLHQLSFHVILRKFVVFNYKIFLNK